MRRRIIWAGWAILLALPACSPTSIEKKDGSKVGDLIVFGRGSHELPKGGRLHFLTANRRLTNMKLGEQEIIAVAIILKGKVEISADPIFERDPAWIYRVHHVWKVRMENKHITERQFPCELNGRENIITLDGQRYSLKDGKVFIVIVDDIYKIAVTQYNHDLGSGSRGEILAEAVWKLVPQGVQGGK